MYRHGHHAKAPRGGRKVTTYVVAVLVFLSFFALSNYYMGLFSSSETAKPITKPRPPLPDIGRIRKKPLPTQPQYDQEPVRENVLDGLPQASPLTVNDGNTGEEGKDRQRENKRPPPPPLKRDDTPAVVYTDSDLVPYYEDEQTPDIPDDPKGCKATRKRDYKKDPIVIGGRWGGEEKCDVPCMGESGTPDASVGFKSGTCPAYSIFFTMENSIPSPGSYDIIANTQLTCDVPLPYFSWAEYPFARPVNKKTAKAHVAAFISNCGPQRRQEWMRAMMDAGVQIDSYGACMRNAHIPSEYQSKYGSDYNAIKMDIISTYKFVMAFENSHTDDYVTEKLFGVLVAGSVPLYDGASNGKNFGPAAKSMLFANDYGTPEKLAEYILYLDKNDTAYEEYLQWKKTGPSDDWVALIDLANVHSNCRLCIRAADMHRKDKGPVLTGQPKGEKKPAGESLELHVRERGKFWLRKIYLTELTITELKGKLSGILPHDSTSYLHSFYELWSRNPIKTDADVAALSQKAEIEAIFVTPQDWRGRDLMW